MTKNLKRLVHLSRVAPHDNLFGFFTSFRMTLTRSRVTVRWRGAIISLRVCRIDMRPVPVPSHEGRAHGKAHDY